MPTVSSWLPSPLLEPVVDIDVFVAVEAGAALDLIESDMGRLRTVMRRSSSRLFVGRSTGDAGPGGDSKVVFSVLFCDPPLETDSAMSTDDLVRLRLLPRDNLTWAIVALRTRVKCLDDVASSTCSSSLSSTDSIRDDRLLFEANEVALLSFRSGAPPSWSTSAANAESTCEWS